MVLRRVTRTICKGNAGRSILLVTCICYRSKCGVEVTVNVSGGLCVVFTSSRTVCG